jgi:superfamily I DNA/RNA helicase/CRISPR/Cas system-associated exonuclease Cas4 (RecB family)
MPARRPSRRGPGRGYHGLVASRLLSDLNEAQLEAVTHPSGPLMVVAGAGSGKTRVITRRIAWLASQGTAPEQMLALTFSTKAAEEMRVRAEGLLEEPYEELSCSTFHAFCTRLLQEEALDGGFDPFFHPVAPADRLALLLDRGDELTFERHEMWGNPAGLISKLIDRVDRLKDECVSAHDYRSWAQSLADSADDEVQSEQALLELEFARFYEDHDRMLDEAGVLDFGELILRSIQLLGERLNVRRRLSERYRTVLVDEYQDTNFAQGVLLRLLVKDNRDVCVVGDDDQSIYRFRGASRKNIADFERHFPDAKVVRLEQNYRSRRAILDASNAVIEQSEDRLPKRLRPTVRDRSSDPAPVSFWRCENERAQAQAVAAELEAVIAEGTPPGNTAVLVRSVRGEGQLVATALEERGIPHVIAGSGAFYERSEVRDLLAWLRLLLDPNDGRAVVRALMRPPVELNSVDLARTTQIARRRKLDMVTALGAALQAPEVPPDSRERIETFLRLYRSAARAFDEMRPDMFVDRLIERIGLRKQQLFTGERRSLERLMNIAKFAGVASTWLRRKPGGTAREFAAYVVAAAAAGLREEEAAAPGAEQTVQVLTMHGAKGLEFDYVYVLGLQLNRMPGARRQAQEPVPDDLLKEELPANTRQQHLAEMRRLMYVAMTRARKRLVLAWPETTSSAGTRVQQQPSPFYEEAMTALGAQEEERAEELLGVEEDLLSAFRALRDEVLGGATQVGTEIGEMRLDAHLDAARAVARYLELLKLAALIERRPRQSLTDAVEEVNQLLVQGASQEQREFFFSSGLDERLLEAERERDKRHALIAARSEPSLESFIPMRGDGVLLSATDIEIYKICPLRYKYARVFSIPRESTLQQRFGILVHQVLERFHSQLANEQAVNGDGDLERVGSQGLRALYEAGWRRAGFGESNEERQLYEKGLDALVRYHDDFSASDATPVWFERSFSFRLGSHMLRGRVDRVDRHPDGSFELIDYKTGKAKKPSQLKDDVQLSLYQIGAKESWKLDASKQSYYYVLDAEQVPLEASEETVEQVQETAIKVAEGIRAQQFEPRPSFQACSRCDFQLICPAAEK